MNRLDRFFEISARGSSVGAEIRGGIVTFIAMAYIIVLNPIILSSADVSGNKLEFGQVSATTALGAHRRRRGRGRRRCHLVVVQHRVHRVGRGH